MPEETQTDQPLEEIMFDSNDGADANSTANVPEGDGTPDTGTASSYEDSQDSGNDDLAQQVKNLTKQLSDRNSYISKQSEDIKELTGSVSELKGRVEGITAVNPEDERHARDNEILEDVPGAFTKMEQKWEKKFNEALAKKDEEFSKKMNAQKAYDKAWDNFYDSNRHLKDHKDDIVPYVFEKLKPEIRNMSDADAFDRIKTEANKAILRLQRKFGGGKVDTRGMPSGGAGYQGSGNQSEKNVSLADLADDVFDAHNEIVNRTRGRSSVSK